MPLGVAAAAAQAGVVPRVRVQPGRAAGGGGVPGVRGGDRAVEVTDGLLLAERHRPCRQDRLCDTNSLEDPCHQIGFAILMLSEARAIKISFGILMLSQSRAYTGAPRNGSKQPHLGGTGNGDLVARGLDPRRPCHQDRLWDLDASPRAVSSRRHQETAQSSRILVARGMVTWWHGGTPSP